MTLASADLKTAAAEVDLLLTYVAEPLTWDAIALQAAWTGSRFLEMAPRAETPAERDIVLNTLSCVLDALRWAYQPR